MKTIFKLLGLAGLLLFSSPSNAQCSLSTSGNQLICCAGGAVTLTANLTATTCTCPDITYSWSPATGLNTTTGNTVVASPTITTTYTLCAYAYNLRAGTCITACCSTCAVITVSVSSICCRITGIEELSGSSEIQVFPNPAKNVLNVDLGRKSGETTVGLYDVTGKMIMETKVTDGKLNINTAAYTRGIYLLKIYDGNNKAIATRKIILE
jgi:hypothetical protein